MRHPSDRDSRWSGLLAGERSSTSPMLRDEPEQRRARRGTQSKLGGARTMLVVALRKDGALLGVIAVFRQEVRPFTDKQIALLAEFRGAGGHRDGECAAHRPRRARPWSSRPRPPRCLQVINSSPGDLRRCSTRCWKRHTAFAAPHSAVCSSTTASSSALSRCAAMPPLCRSCAPARS